MCLVGQKLISKKYFPQFHVFGATKNVSHPFLLLATQPPPLLTSVISSCQPLPSATIYRRLIENIFWRIFKKHNQTFENIFFFKNLF